MPLTRGKGFLWLLVRGRFWCGNRSAFHTEDRLSQQSSLVVAVTSQRALGRDGNARLLSVGAVIYCPSIRMLSAAARARCPAGGTAVLC